MKYAMIAVLGLFTLWILVETNMGRLYRIAYGDITPPDILYTGEKIQAHDIVLDTVMYPWNSDHVVEYACGISCKWILEETPFKILRLQISEGPIIHKEPESRNYVATMLRMCKGWHDDGCISVKQIDGDPNGYNSLVIRDYSIIRRFVFADYQYLGYQVCFKGRVIAQYGQTKWMSRTWLANLFQVGRGALGREMTGSMIYAGKQMELLLHEVVKVNYRAKGENQCPRISIGV